MSSKNNKVEIVNMYKILPSKYKDKQMTYKNYDKMKINLPARILIVGSSGSGKTNVTVSLLKLFSCFSKVYLFARNLEESLYKFLIDFFEKLGKKMKQTILYYSNDVADIPSADEFDKNESNLVIFDDLITEKNLQNVSEIYIRGRKENITSLFLSQSYYKTPQLIRQNCDYIILKKINTTKDLSRIMSEYNLGDISKEDLIKIYKLSTKTLTDFFMIDLNTNDPNLKYRHNFEGFKVEQNEDEQDEND